MTHSVVSPKGGKVHAAEDGRTAPLCPASARSSDFGDTDFEINCKSCLKILAQREADRAVTTETLDEANERTRAVVRENIERVRSFAEAENVEGAEELTRTTEALIDALPAGERADLHHELVAAGRVEPPRKPSKEVASLETKRYQDVEGATELVEMGGQIAREAIELDQKRNLTAQRIAETLLDIRKRILTKEGHPDLTGRTHAAKTAATALYSGAAEVLGKADMDEFDFAQSLKKVQRASQRQMSDVHAAYLRSLDKDASERKRFSRLLKEKPKGVKASQFVADHYDLSLKGRREIEREEYYANKELGKAERPELEAFDPDERVQESVKRIRSDVQKVKPEYFEGASPTTKKKAREELTNIRTAVENMIAATLS